WAHSSGPEDTYGASFIEGDQSPFLYSCMLLNRVFSSLHLFVQLRLNGGNDLIGKVIQMLHLLCAPLFQSVSQVFQRVIQLVPRLRTLVRRESYTQSC